MRQGHTRRLRLRAAKGVLLTLISIYEGREWLTSRFDIAGGGGGEATESF